MRKITYYIYTFLFAVLLFTTASGQQIPTIGYYNYQPKLFNPASLGGPDGGMVGIQYRNQWLDLDASERPQTYLAFADVSPVISKSGRLGLGIRIMSDQTHIIKRLGVNGFFGYHLIPEGKHRLSLGVTAGVVNSEFDFSEARVSDITLAALFDGAQSYTKFDGGPGLQYRYIADKGSQVNFGLALPQIFTSDIEFSEKAGFDISPHLLSTLSFRIQGNGFAIEPLVLVRMILGDKELKAGNYDLNLRAHFLDDRLWVGGGFRTDMGGYNVALGVSPIPSVDIVAGFESHMMFGNTLEFGAYYTFGGEQAGPYANLDSLKQSSEDALYNSEVEAASIRQNLSEAEKSFAAAQAALGDKNEMEAQIDRTDQSIAKAQEQLEELKRQVMITNDNLAEANRIDGIADPRVRRSDLKSIENADLEANNLALMLEQEINQLSEAVEQFKRDNKISDVNIADLTPNALQSYLNQQLEDLEPKPEEMSPVKVESKSNSNNLVFEFPDENHQYYSADRSPEIRGVSNHITELIRKIEQQGGEIISINLMANLQDSPEGLQIGADTPYGGEFGDNILLTYNFDDKDDSSFPRTKRINIKTGAINIEELAALKLQGIKQELMQKANVPGNRITLNLVSSDYESAFTQKTLVTIVLKK